jgi:two-component system, LytTR family, sensor kinase
MDKSFLNGLIQKPSARGRWSYFLTMPVFLTVFSYLLVGPPYFNDWRIFVGASLLNGAILTGTFFAQNYVSEQITRTYSGLGQTVKRIFVSVLSHAVLSGIFLLLVATLYVRFGLFGSSLSYQTLILIYGINMAAIILVMSIQETFHSLTHWKLHEVNKEKLRKENVQGQLQSLKAQVSPHFLFNGLNSLSTLIAEDPGKAEQFVEQMAKVYRYLLQTNQSSDAGENIYELTTLENELVFIESYYHLLKTRYREGLHLQIDVDQASLPHRLPPLTLQLLIENAVKHNVIRQGSPLMISIITTENGLLQVRNNLQKKTATPGMEKLESTQLGLTNILAKYRLLEEYQPELASPEIENGPDNFTVTIPLISKVSTSL